MLVVYLDDRAITREAQARIFGGQMHWNFVFFSTIQNKPIIKGLNFLYIAGFPSYGLIPSGNERSPTALYNFADVTTGVPTIQRSEPSPLPTVSTSPLQRANDTQALLTAHSQAQALANAQRSGMCLHYINHVYIKS